MKVHYIIAISTLRVCNTCPVSVRDLQRIYLVRKDIVAGGGMMEDNQLLNWTITAPVLDGRPFSVDDAEPPQK